MSDLLRVLYRPGYEQLPAGGGMPKGNSKEAQKALGQIGEYLLAHRLKPVPLRELSAADLRMGVRGGGLSDEDVLQTMDAMTISDRIHLEIEMIESGGASYASDYDPLRY